MVPCLRSGHLPCSQTRHQIHLQRLHPPKTDFLRTQNQEYHRFRFVRRVDVLVDRRSLRVVLGTDFVDP